MAFDGCVYKCQCGKSVLTLKKHSIIHKFTMEGGVFNPVNFDLATSCTKPPDVRAAQEFERVSLIEHSCGSLPL